MVLGPLISNYATMKGEFDKAQANMNNAFAAVEEYVRQVAETLSLDITKDYSFDIVTKLFVERAATVIASTAEALKEKS